MNLKIETKKININIGTYSDLLEIEMINAEESEEQMINIIDYISDTYGKSFFDYIKKRFELDEIDNLKYYIMEDE